jgi:hypothetical protein
MLVDSSIKCFPKALVQLSATRSKPNDLAKGFVPPIETTHLPSLPIHKVPRYLKLVHFVLVSADQRLHTLNNRPKSHHSQLGIVVLHRRDSSHNPGPLADLGLRLLMRLKLDNFGSMANPVDEETDYSHIHPWSRPVHEVLWSAVWCFIHFLKLKGVDIDTPFGFL